MGWFSRNTLSADFMESLVAYTAMSYIESWHKAGEEPPATLALNVLATRIDSSGNKATTDRKVQLAGLAMFVARWVALDPEEMKEVAVNGGSKPVWTTMTGHAREALANAGLI